MVNCYRLIRVLLVALAPLPVMTAIWYFVRVALGKRFEKNQKAVSRTNDLTAPKSPGTGPISAIRLGPMPDRFCDSTFTWSDVKSRPMSCRCKRAPSLTGPPNSGLRLRK